jgi:hypothetical protein
MTRNTKITLIVLACVGGGLLVVCGGGGLFLYFAMRDAFEQPTNIAVWVTAPDTVKTGELVVIEVRVVNQANHPQVIDSIDIYNSYLEGVKLRSSTPAWRSSMAILDFVTYDYQLSIPAQGEQIVKFDAIALKPGDYLGDIDVCINNEMSYITQVVRTVVNDENSSSNTSASTD